MITPDEIKATEKRVAAIARLKDLSDRVDLLDRLAIFWVLEALQDAEQEARQNAEIMREQGAELRDAEEAAYFGWLSGQDGA